jgi:hypothetical protein
MTRKKVPSFWWDFTEDLKHVIVESDSLQFPIVGKFKIAGKLADPEIKKATDLMDDLRAGRISMKQAKEDMLEQEKNDTK